MHSKLVVHRDLNPRNIFLHFGDTIQNIKEATVKIIDFNSSKILINSPHFRSEESPSVVDLEFFSAENQEFGRDHFELTTARVGTPMYRAPELIARHKYFTTAIDVWGIGCTVYFLLVGKPPFDPN